MERIKIGITGASGFLGSSILSFLVQDASFEVRAFIRSTSHNVRDQLTSDCNEKVEWMRGDLNSADDCEHFVRLCDIVLHLAHNQTPFHSAQGLAANLSANLLPTLNLLESIKKQGSRPHLIYFSSGGQIYGESADHIPLTEVSECLPITSYGVQKLSIEHYIRLWTELGYLRSTILRVANPYGHPLPAIRMQGLIGVALELIRQNQPVPIIGSLEVVRDYLHLDDLNSVVLKVIHSSPTLSFNVLNIGTGTGYRVDEVLNTISHISGREVKTEYRPLPSGVIIPQWNVLNCSKAEQLLGWKAEATLTEGISKMCQLLNSN